MLREHVYPDAVNSSFVVFLDLDVAARAFEVACGTVWLSNLSRTVEDQGVGKQCPQPGPSLVQFDRIGNHTLRNGKDGTALRKKRRSGGQDASSGGVGLHLRVFLSSVLTITVASVLGQP